MGTKLQFKHKAGMKCKVYLSSYEEAMRFKEDRFTFATIKRVIVFDKTYTYIDSITKIKHTCNTFELILEPLKESIENYEVDKFLTIENRSNSPYKIKFLKEPKEFVRKICREVEN